MYIVIYIKIWYTSILLLVLEEFASACFYPILQAHHKLTIHSTIAYIVLYLIFEHINDKSRHLDY